MIKELPSNLSDLALVTTIAQFCRLDKSNNFKVFFKARTFSAGAQFLTTRIKTRWFNTQTPDSELRAGKYVNRKKIQPQWKWINIWAQEIEFPVQIGEQQEKTRTKSLLEYRAHVKAKACNSLSGLFHRQSRAHRAQKFSHKKFPFSHREGLNIVLISFSSKHGAFK